MLWTFEYGEIKWSKFETKCLILKMRRPQKVKNLMTMC